MKKCFLKCFKSSDLKEIPHIETQPNLKTEPEGHEIEIKEGYFESAPIGENNIRFLVTSLQKLPIFRCLKESELTNSSVFFRHLTITPNKEIVTQGEPGSFFYILMTGICKVIQNNVEVSVLKTGSVFGELALLTSEKRKSTVKAVTQCTLYALDKRSFKSIISELQARELESFELMLNGSPFFSRLSAEQKEKVFDISYLSKFKAGEKICGEGDEAYFVYFLLKGSLDVLVANKIVGSIEENRLFGEMSLINPLSTQRLASIVCKEESFVYLISIDQLLMILGTDYRSILLKNIVFNCLMGEKLLNFLPLDMIHSIADSFQFQDFTQGSPVINSALDLNSTIVVVCFGKIFSMKKSFGSYSVIGLRNSNHLKVGTGKFKSEGFSVVGKISLSIISKIISSDSKDLIGYLSKLSELKSIRFLNDLDFNELNFVLKNVETQTFNRGEVIFSNDLKDEKVYIVDSGAVGVYEEESFVFRYDPKSVFGEDCLVGTTREKKAKALTQVSCLSLKKEDMASVLNDKMLSYIHLMDKISAIFDLETLKFFKCIKKQFNRDWFLAYNEEKDAVLTSEVVYKSEIKTFEQFQQVVNQKCVVAQLDHPHIPRYIRTLSDSKRVYFFYEYFNSVSLRELVESKLTEKAARFLLSNLLNTVDYLHQKGILHRNLSPENVLIDKFGFAKLTGFQFSKQAARSYTLLDTQVEYKAKEVILGNAYTKESELWSCGVILYEMIHGKLPFGIQQGDGYEAVVGKIINADLIKISGNVSSAGRVVLNGLLHGNPDKRLRIEELLKNSWFSGICFEDIFYSRAQPEFVPMIREIDSNQCKNKLKPRNSKAKSDINTAHKFDWDLYF